MKRLKVSPALYDRLAAVAEQRQVDVHDLAEALLERALGERAGDDAMSLIAGVGVGIGAALAEAFLTPRRPQVQLIRVPSRCSHPVVVGGRSYPCGLAHGHAGGHQPVGVQRATAHVIDPAPRLLPAAKKL